MIHARAMFWCIALCLIAAPAVQASYEAQTFTVSKPSKVRVTLVHLEPTESNNLARPSFMVETPLPKVPGQPEKSVMRLVKYDIHVNKTLRGHVFGTFTVPATQCRVHISGWNEKFNLKVEVAQRTDSDQYGPFVEALRLRGTLTRDPKK